MNPKTEKMLAEMVAYARTGAEIIPAFWQPHFGMGGISATVSAAITAGKRKGLLVECGKDGCGKPKYTIAAPAPTHTGPKSIN
jgi:hypothetical protein